MSNRGVTMPTMHRRFLCLAGLSAVFLFCTGLTCLAQATQTASPAMRVYVAGRDGIHLLNLDLASENLSPLEITPCGATGFLAIAPNKRFLYALGSSTDANHHRTDELLAMAIDPSTGKLTPLNHQPTKGEGSCFVTIDPQGKNALVASYGSATVSVIPIAADGQLSAASCVIKQTGSSIDPERQTHAYAHSVNLDTAGRFAFVADLGADKLFVYRFDPIKGLLTPNDLPAVIIPPGSGPRHFTFDPTGKFAYLVTEMGGTVIGYSYDAAAGALRQLQIISTLPTDFKGKNTSAEVQIDPTGKFLYASNRLDTNFITIFSRDVSSGMLSLIGYQSTMGKVPRNFRVDPTGQFLIAANQNSDSIVTFRIDPGTGKLTAAGDPLAVPTPMCVKFLEIEKKRSPTTER